MFESFKCIFEHKHLNMEKYQYAYETALCNLWSGVMEWSLGVESWSGLWSGFWSGMM